MDHICQNELVADHFYLYHTSNMSTSNQHRHGFQNKITEGAYEMSEGALALMYIKMTSILLSFIAMVITVNRCNLERETSICVLMSDMSVIGYIIHCKNAL